MNVLFTFQLLPVFSVFPMEQILTFDDGIALTEDDKCLVDLGVTPGKHLYLSVSSYFKDPVVEFCARLNFPPQVISATLYQIQEFPTEEFHADHSMKKLMC